MELMRLVLTELSYSLLPSRGIHNAREGTTALAHGGDNLSILSISAKRTFICRMVATSVVHATKFHLPQLLGPNARGLLMDLL